MTHIFPNGVSTPRHEGVKVFSGKEYRLREGHQRQGLSEYRSGWAWKLELLAGDGYGRLELGGLEHGERYPQEDR